MVLSGCAGPSHNGLLTSPAPAKVLYAEAGNPQKVDSFMVGDGGPEIIAIVDPDCIFCHKFYEQVMPLVSAGKLRVRFVVASFLKPSSEPRAAAILSARDPAQALAQNEAGFDDRTEEGGIAEDQHPAFAVMADVRKNNRFLSSTGEVATPTLIFATRDGGYRVMHGTPQDMVGFLGNLRE